MGIFDVLGAVSLNAKLKSMAGIIAVQVEEKREKLAEEEKMFEATMNGEDYSCSGSLALKKELVKKFMNMEKAQ